MQDKDAKCHWSVKSDVWHSVSGRSEISSVKQHSEPVPLWSSQYCSVLVFSPEPLVFECCFPKTISSFGGTLEGRVSPLGGPTSSGIGRLRVDQRSLLHTRRDVCSEIPLKNWTGLGEASKGELVLSYVNIKSPKKNTCIPLRVKQWFFNVEY
jgi:hypothetical protein